MAYDFTVEQHGTDTSGRPLLFTRVFWGVLEAIKNDPRCAPFAHLLTYVQGSFMLQVGGGADASAGVHNRAGAIDYRTWNLTLAWLNILIVVAREHGLALYRRDQEHGGFDEHAHGAGGWDSPLDPGLAYQWRAYIDDLDGLASAGPDYEWRPSPLVLTPVTTNPPEDYMATSDAERKLDQILAALENVDADVAALGGEQSAAFKRAYERDKAAAKKAREVASRQIKTLGSVVDALTEVATETDVDKLHARLARVKRQILDALAADPDVDGAENPAAAGA